MVLCADLILAGLDVEDKVLAPMLRLNPGANLPLIPFFSTLDSLLGAVTRFCHP
jgi:hypothetical protein